MKYVIIGVAFLFTIGGFVPSASAATVLCGDPSLSTPSITYVGCGGGSPELVVNAWGTTNNQLPHILQGSTVNGLTCPWWFPMYCVDIRGTAYFQARWK